jgi:hypothetical protein
VPQALPSFSDPFVQQLLLLLLLLRLWLLPLLLRLLLRLQQLPHLLACAALSLPARKQPISWLTRN